MRLLNRCFPALVTLLTTWAFIFSPALKGQTIQNIVNSASFTTEMAPGSWVAIYGTNLAPAAALAQTAPYATQLNGVSVTFGGMAVPIQYISPNQVNALVPFEVASIPPDMPPGTLVQVPVVVSTPSGSSLPYNIALQRDAPAIFTKNSAGTGDALAFDSNFNPVTVAGTNPIIIYATGLGPTNPPASSSALGASMEPLNRTVDPVIVIFAHAAANVMFAGLAPGFDAVYQVNFQPQSVGDNSLILQAGTGQAPLVTLPVPPPVTNVSGSITPLYPPPEMTATLLSSPLLSAASFSVSFDILPTAGQFSVVATASDFTATIVFSPPSNSWSATYIVPTAAAANGDFSHAGFTALDFLANGLPFPNNQIPFTLLNPNALMALSMLPMSNVPLIGPSANAQFHASGTIPANGHITPDILGLPSAFGGFDNVPFTQGTFSDQFTLKVDNTTVASTSTSYSVPAPATPPISNVANVSGSITPLYPPSGTTTALQYSPLLSAASFSVSFDILPTAGQFSVVASASDFAATIVFTPASNSWSATYTVPTVLADEGNFSNAGFTPLDFLNNGLPFPGNILPPSRLLVGAVQAEAMLPISNVASTGSANAQFQDSGRIPANGHITLNILGLPSAFGGFDNVPFTQGTSSDQFTLKVDNTIVASTATMYSVPDADESTMDSGGSVARHGHQVDIAQQVPGDGANQ